MSALMTGESTSAPAAGALPELPELLRMFNEVSVRLSETHHRLEDRVAGLQRELADAQEGLRRSRALAALGEMAAGIAHEVRNPLASMALHAEVLREDLVDRPAQCELLEKIARAIARLDAIVGDVLRFARSAHGEMRSMPVRDAVDDAVSACRAEISDARVEVECRVAAALEAFCDPTALIQAIVNLIRNAVEAISEAGASVRRIRIDASERERLGTDGRRARMTVIAVEDSGPGFDPKVVDRVFTPFVTTRAAGTGLGLAIVHRIADAHSGAVRIERAETGGARIEFMIPAPVARGTGDDSRSQTWDA